jgi:hypothetical protein
MNNLLMFAYALENIPSVDSDPANAELCSRYFKNYADVAKLSRQFRPFRDC